MVEVRFDDSIYNVRSFLKGWNCVYCFILIWLYMKCCYKSLCIFICRMIELDEVIEVLDVVIEYKNDNISSKKLEFRYF